MKTIKFLTGAMTLALCFGITSYLNGQEAAKEEAKDGKTIFLESKCSSCHSIAALNIEAKVKKDNYPDLSTVGDKVAPGFIKKYLKKEETLNDKKHLIAFKGEESELDILATWLESLKAEPQK